MHWSFQAVGHQINYAVIKACLDSFAQSMHRVKLLGLSVTAVGSLSPQGSYGEVKQLVQLPSKMTSPMPVVSGSMKQLFAMGIWSGVVLLRISPHSAGNLWQLLATNCNEQL